MAKTFQGREGALRIYDGTTPPRYVEIPFVQMNLSAPLGKPRPIDPIVPTVGGYVHAPTGPDYDQAFFEPVTLAFSAWVEARSFPTIKRALSNLGRTGTWTVGPHTWTTTKGRGSVVMSDGTYRATQPFFDQMKFAADVQVKWQDAVSGSIFAMRYDEAYFPPQSAILTESPEYVEISVSALVYGNIEEISNFSSGTASLSYEE